MTSQLQRKSYFLWDLMFSLCILLMTGPFFAGCEAMNNKEVSHTPQPLLETPSIEQQLCYPGSDGGGGEGHG